MFRKKQVLADQRFAEKIYTRDANPSSNSPMHPIRIRAAMQMQLRNVDNNSQDIQEFLQVAAASGANIMELLDGGIELRR